MRLKLRHPLSLEWKHYEHDWTDIWYAVAALAVGILGVVLQFAGYPVVGFALYGIAFGVQRARQALLVRPLTLLGTGLLIALVSGLPSVLRGQPFLTAFWPPGPVPLGTPAVFDIGVFLVVGGVVLMMIFSLAEES